MNRERTSRPTPEWREAKRFEDNGLVVRVEILEGTKPEYSIQVCQTRRNGADIVPYLRAEVQGKFQITLRPLAGPIHSLLLKAEEWVQNDAATRVSEEIEIRIVKETMQVNKDRPVTRHTGKTAKRKARLAASKAA